MRGLNGAEAQASPRPSGAGTARHGRRAAVRAAALSAVLCTALAACGADGTGARDEGPAHTGSGGSTTARPSPSASASAPSATPGRADAVRLVKDDPRIAAAVKRDLKPCVGDEYPVDVSYGNLTGAAADDIVVNVMTCGDAVGVGSYVYREENGAYRDVFRAEEPPVYAEIDRGDLVVTKQVYERGDPVSSPSGENVITYHWTSGTFAEEYRTHNDYSSAVEGDVSPSPSPTRT
ncbi:hypothetical protein ACIQU5_18915 [Streptomyces sp. NPDC090306]|uniref:hypothetical protein n=1 Tax=Streptomyces sp. NPDC090306 TaxID=3365961 RepID=UPI00381021D0